MLIIVIGVFFLQAEDGIRDGHVTGVQTCALPIYHWSITSAGGGMLNGRIQFQDIDSLVGGTNLDQFVLSGWGSVSQIDGGELGVHGPNTVQLEEGVNRSFSIGLGAPDTDIQLVNIGNVRASASDGHVLIGANQTNKWLIDDENAGKLNDQVDFTGFTF